MLLSLRGTGIKLGRLGWFWPRQPTGDAVGSVHGLGDNRLGMTGYTAASLLGAWLHPFRPSHARGSRRLAGAMLRALEFWSVTTLRNGFSFCGPETKVGWIFGIGESMGVAQLLQIWWSGYGFLLLVVAESSFSNFLARSVLSHGATISSRSLGRANCPAAHG